VLEAENVAGPPQHVGEHLGELVGVGAQKGSIVPGPVVAGLPIINNSKGVPKRQNRN
jgi:hypothetical protein